MLALRKRSPVRFAAGLILGIAAMLASSGISRAAEEPAPRVAVDRLTHDFGRVPRGTVVTGSFTVRNVGSAPLAIGGMQFSTPGLRARVSATIEPGASAPLVITWDTTQYTREAVGQAMLILNDPTTPKLVLTLQGFVVSPIDVEPAPAFYLSQFAGESATQSITIRVNQEREVNIQEVEKRGEGYTLKVEPIELGRRYELHATVASTLPPGRYQESAVIHTNDPDRPRIRLEVNILVKQAVHASVDAVDMGRVRIASLKANPSRLELLRQTVILESRSPTMQISHLESDLPFITLDRDPAVPAQRIHIDVGLDPAKLAPGQYRGSVRIRTDVEGATDIILPVELTATD